MNILKQIYNIENFSQNCHLNWQNQYYLYTVQNFIHLNTHHVIMDERMSLSVTNTYSEKVEYCS